MRGLKWNETELIECLGVLPVKDEYDTHHSFKVKRDGLIFDLSLWQYDNLATLDIRKETDNDPFVSLSFLIRDEIKFVDEREYSCLRFKDCIFVPSVGVWAYQRGQGIDLFDKSRFPFSFDVELITFPKIRFRVAPF